MRIVVFFVLLAGSLFLSACSSKPAKTAEATTNTSATTASAPQPTFDTKKPTSFEEYKQWRKLNDPDSTAYAEYKEWEAQQRQWKKVNDL